MPIIAVKGTHDIYGEEAEAYAYIENLFKAVCQLYGYHEMRTPILEYTEAFNRSTGEGSDVVRKEMYTFEDKGGRSVTMRPEFTAGIARSIVEHKLYATEDMPIKVSYVGPAFRYERPQQGRYRQFIQAGVECVGEDSARLDAETIALAISFLSMLGFEDLTLKVNCLGDKGSRQAYKEALKEYFSGRIDEMCGDCHDRLSLNPMRILDCKVPNDRKIAEGAPKMRDYLSEASEKRFYETLSIINDLGIEYEIDDGLVRGLDYYAEIVFEIEATSKTGQNYGALLGGGHYDGLLEAMGGPEGAGVGFAFGIERVYSIMRDNGMLEGIAEPLDIYLMPIGEESIEAAFSLLMIVRSLGFSAEMPVKSAKLGSLFRKAERKRARFALILGENELKEGKAQLKNMRTQEQVSISLDDIEGELDHYFQEEHEATCHDEHHHHHEE